MAQIELTPTQLSYLQYGKSQFPWLKEKISKVLEDPTKEGIKNLAESVEGNFKTILLNIIEE